MGYGEETEAAMGGVVRVWSGEMAERRPLSGIWSGGRR